VWRGTHVGGTRVSREDYRGRGLLEGDYERGDLAIAYPGVERTISRSAYKSGGGRNSEPGVGMKIKKEENFPPSSEHLSLFFAGPGANIQA